MRLSEIAENAKGSAIREMFDIALDVKDVISFTVGEPDFVTPKPILEKVCEEWKKGYTHYTPNKGIIELREAIAEYHQKNLAPSVDTQILVTCGATEALELALFAIINPGDEVIIITPAWSNYFNQVAMCGGRAVTVPAHESNGFIVDPEDVKAAITPKTKAIFLNSPSNPTGAVIDYRTMEALAEIFRENSIYILADEVYSQIIYEGEYTSITSFPGLKDKIIYINSFSKMFAMTGWRIGYAISSPKIISAMTKLHENGVSCLPYANQSAAAFALKNCLPEIKRMNDVFRVRRNEMISLVNNIKGLSCIKPNGAFYLFVNAKEITNDSKSFCTNILKNTGVVVVPGVGFGDSGEGYFRMTYANSLDNIVLGLGRIKQYIDSL